MLQDVYKEKGGAKASSLYCVWVCDEKEAHPVAVWIDSEMRAFGGQSGADRSNAATEEWVREQSPTV